MEEQPRSNDRARVDGRVHAAPHGHAAKDRIETGRRSATFTIRDLLSIGFRQRRLVLVSFLVTFSAACLLVLLRPAQYESEMKILVKRERVDPLVTPEASSQQSTWPGVTEEELNSEVELLKSRDLLEHVVVAAGLDRTKETGVVARLKKLVRGGDEPKENDRETAAAVQRFTRKLEIQPLRKSNIIRVSFASTQPETSTAVLKTLATRYLEKHLAVHRPSGAFDFFDRETERYGGQLALAQAKLTQQNDDEGVVSVQSEREVALRLLGDLEASQLATQALIAETSERIRVLQSQLDSTPIRRTTEVRSGSARLVEQLYITLSSHELKRIELLEAFQPDYPPVREVEAQIAKVKAAIAEAERSPLVEETTDQNPTHDYLVTELAKGRSELAALRARAVSTTRSLSMYQTRARRLEQVGLAQQTLVRTAAQAEQNYVTYARKREEARIANALDDQRIVNVAIAEEATVPFEPSGPSRSLLLLIAAVAAALFGLVLAFVVDALDPSFRTPEEIETVLGVRVIAAIPQVPVPSQGRAG
ncbi:MAG TPA: Wzz/FepE/Etk N-terminal domain-containing protein [Vicinamibacterales bacterium]